MNDFIKLCVFVFFISISNNSWAQKHDNSLEKTIFKVLKAYQSKDEKTLNTLIQKDFGIAILYKRGVYDNLAIVDRLTFNRPIPEYLAFDHEISTDYKIHFGTLPEFSCDTLEWNKPHGIYCDVNKIDKTLSTVAKDENKILEENVWSSQKIKKLEEIENKSHKIIAIGKEGNVFIFYLMFHKNKWYLVAIDRFEVCDA